MQVQRLFFDLTKKANDEGVYYPLWATCLGFEAIAIIAANDYNLLQDFDAWNISLPLEFAQAYKNSRIFGNMSDQLISIFKNQAVTQNNHHYGGMSWACLYVNSSNEIHCSGYCSLER